VVFVDGDGGTRERVRDCLGATDGDLRVETVGDGTTAVDRIESTAVDCLVVGEVPAESPVELVERVGDRRPDLPVVLHPGDGSETLAGEALAAGVDGYRPREEAADGCATLAGDIVEVVRDRRESAGIFDRMSEAVFSVDSDWQFTRLNERCRAIISEVIGRDLTVGQLRGRELWDVLPDGSGSQFSERLHAAMDGQESVEFEEYLPPLDSWFEVRAFPSPDGLTAYARDVTDRRAYEERLEHRRSVLTRMYRVVSDKELDPDEKVGELLSIGREELGTEYGSVSRVEGTEFVLEVVQGPEGCRLSPDEEAPLAWRSCERTVADEDGVVVNNRTEVPLGTSTRSDDGAVSIECHIGTQVVVDGEIHGTFCFYGQESREEPFSQWEITLVDLMGNWVSHERERQRHMEALTRERNRLEEFASVVSHDLRNPLNVALGHMEIAKRDCDSDSLDTATDALGRMESLIEDVLALARMGQQVVEEETTELAELVRAASNSVGDESINIVVDEELTVEGDVSRLQQLFENLFRNAIEHATADGRVTVRVGALPGGKGFFVADDGPGIPEDDRQDVFDNGFTTTSDGTGFGLSIVEEIVTAHGGDVTVTDSDDGGARFEITGIEAR